MNGSLGEKQGSRMSIQQRPRATVKGRVLRTVSLGAALVVLIQSLGGEAMGQTGGSRWVTAWATSQQGLGRDAISDATIRMIARVTLPGQAVRLRIDNTYGTSPLTIGAAYVGRRMRRAMLVPGSNRQVRFNGSSRVTIAPGASIHSDPVSMDVLDRQDVAVSLYLPGADLRPSQHTQAQTTSYLTADGVGNVAAAEADVAFTETTTSMLWLKGIDVLAEASASAIVAFGDSITDGSCSTLDAHDRWEDWLETRLDLSDRARAWGAKAIVNEGIGGNTITRDELRPAPNSTPGLERLERDALSHEGVSHVVLFMGTNDIRREASAAAVISGMEDIIRRVKARGVKILGATIIPRHNRAPVDDNTGWTPAKTALRNEVNEWIRSRAPFDGVLDFDRAVADRRDPDRMSPPFNCDDIHPTPRGYYEMAGAIPLDLFAP